MRTAEAEAAGEVVVEEDNNWQVIKSKRKGKNYQKNRSIATSSTTAAGLNKKKKKNILPNLNDEEDTIFSSSEFLRRLNHIRQYIKQTKFYQSCSDILTEISSSLALESSSHSSFSFIHKYQKIIILGIGNFTKSSSSCLQLAFCLELFSLHSNIYLYDPLLTPNDIEICHLLDLKIDNSMNIHEADGFTFFYMPHCPYTLYNKILWSNWGHKIRNICILGNSFQSYLLRRIDNNSSIIRSDCMKLLENITTERQIWRNEYRHDEVLNRVGAYYELHSLENAFIDTSLIYFTNETNYQHEILSMERRPCEEDMLADLENDLELIRQEMCF